VFIAGYAAGGANDIPTFSSDPIVKTNAMENSSYSGSIAGDASDPNSDPITFSKTSGPSWLTVASDGTLSGTPSAADAGLNAWTVEVTDSVDGTDDAILLIVVDEINDTPVFVANPFSKADATEGQAYSGTIAADAYDMNINDTLTYSKVSGPNWLSVASDGALSGTPGTNDVGANAFSVKVEDNSGASDTAQMNITVISASQSDRRHVGHRIQPDRHEGNDDLPSRTRRRHRQRPRGLPQVHCQWRNRRGDFGQTQSLLH
jgi:hypothetical protein